MAKVDKDLEAKQQKKFYEDKIASSGFKVTKPRDVIIKILSKASNLLTADDIYMKVKNIDPTIGVATVYRTLELLTRLKIVCRMAGEVCESRPIGSDSVNIQLVVL